MKVWKWAILGRFSGVRICTKLVPGLSRPMTSIPHCVTWHESRMLVEAHYTIRFSGAICGYFNVTWKLTLRQVVFWWFWAPKWDPLENCKQALTKSTKLCFFYNSSRSMSLPSFIEFGQLPFPRSDTLSQPGPLKNKIIVVYHVKVCWRGFRLSLVNGLNPADYFEFFSYNSTRANHLPKLRQPRAKLNRYYYSFSVRIVKHWNALPKEIKELRKTQFLILLKVN